MTYFNGIYNNICCFVSNIMYFSPCEFITTIKNVPSVLFNSKNNLISNIYTCFNINKIFGDTYKHKNTKNIQNTQHINFEKRNNNCSQQKKNKKIKYSNNKTNYYKDIEDNCDWGWFIVIDEYEVYKR